MSKNDDLVRWRWVAGYEGMYEVSDHGQVRSYVKDPGNPHVIAYRVLGDGYYFVNFHRNGETKSIGVARLVLQTFVGPPPTPEHQAAHLDGDRTRNVLGNLVWATPKENCSHRVVHGTHMEGEATPSAKLSAESVRFIRVSKGHMTQKGLAALFGVSNTTIQRIQSREYWQSVR